jgi:glycosyltransferase involved in cell wall biosynthesis
LTGLRTGYVLKEFPPLTETFIRRELHALCRLGNSVFVYANSLVHDPLVPQETEPSLIVREVPFLERPEDLVRTARLDGVEHLHGSLMSDSHRAAQAAARTLQVSFTVTAFSGRDIFTVREPDLYRDISCDPACRGIVVEDPFMYDWMVERFGVLPQKLAILPSSLDLDLYRPSRSRPSRRTLVILAIARFIKKKGLSYLIEAFHRLCSVRDDAELWLVGRGPHEEDLRRAAGVNRRITFPGAMTEAQTREAYADADIFCLPCIQTSDGNADGIPTVVLEAMAFELPIVSSNLLSLPCYVRDGKEGLLVAPRDVGGIVAALDRLCDDAGLRQELGRAGRMRVLKLCDVRRNVAKLQSLFRGEPSALGSRGTEPDLWS